MNFLFNAKVRESKQLQNCERYRKSKIIGKLLAGGFNKGLAKHMSGHVLTPEMDGFVIDEASWTPQSIQKLTSWRQRQASPPRADCPQVHQRRHCGEDGSSRGLHGTSPGLEGLHDLLDLPGHS